MNTLTLRARLLLTIAGAAVLTASPVAVHLGETGWTLDPGYALAKDGRDDDGADSNDDRSGSDRDDDSDDNDDRSGIDRDDGDDDDRSGGDRDDDDDDRSGRSRDEDDDDDRSGSGSGRDDDDSSGSGGRDDDSVGRDNGDERGGTKAEISRNGIEVENADGTKEEIENGRYERKNAAGRTIEERRATQADVDRLMLLSRPNGGNPVRQIEVGAVAKIERSVAGTEVLYTTGWKEELENGRYELKDPNNNTVVERSATPRDVARIERIIR